MIKLVLSLQLLATIDLTTIQWVEAITGKMEMLKYSPKLEVKLKVNKV